MAKNKQTSDAPQHIQYLDIDNSGILKEVAVVKSWGDGSISYIETGLLDQIDKGRLKTILSSPHANKYELWELLSMSKLNNGMIALDYFHQLTKKKNAKGSIERNISGGIFDAEPVSGKMIASDFSDAGAVVGDAHPEK